MRDSNPSSTENETRANDRLARVEKPSNEGAPTRGPTAASRKLTLAFSLLCAVGAALSAELARIHVFVHTDPRYHSVCAMSAGVNCETVALSPYAVFAGLPVAVWGILGYVVMGLLALSGSRKRQRNLTWPWGLLLLLASFSALTSTILAYVSATQIASLCLFCVGSYAVNAGLVVLAVLAWRHSRVRLLHLVRSDAEALRGRPVLTVNLAIVGVTVLLGLELLVPRYWVAPGWTGLPQRPSGLDANGQHWIGASEPVLTIVEFSDYQCPYCRRAHKDVRLLVAKHAKRLRLIHRHLPLDNACHPALSSPFHEHACRLAEAAECAGLQGRFWEMNDALFSTQDRVKAQDVDPMELAVRLGLNRSRFEQCMKGHAAMPRIASDLQAAMARRLDGTPSFLIGEAVYQGRIPETALAALRETTP